MIIPVRCFTCGKVLADKWLYYKERVDRHAATSSDAGKESSDRTLSLEKTFEGRLLDEMGLRRICCRRHFMTHVDLIDVI